MQIELNQQECKNIKIALLSTAKQASVGENEMASLLMLARKFNWVEVEKKEVIKDKK